MNPRPRRTIAAAILVSLLAGAGALPVAAADNSTADWSLDTLDGSRVGFHETLAKGPVVVSFWATWCRPCLKEMPHLDAMAGRYAGEVTFLAVNTDNTRAVAKVAPYINSMGYTNLVVPLDTGGEVQQIMQMGGVLPFVAVYDQQGREVYRHIGYKEGDELELEAAVRAVLAARSAGTAVDTGKPDWAEAVKATDKFNYRYDTSTSREVFENWLDVAYQFGGFRTGIMLNSKAPSEEGERSNEIVHRFFEFASGDVGIRAGHFYGIFGRGLVFNAYEDRIVRVDTRLDGLRASFRSDRIAAAVFSGTPSVREIDLRGADFAWTAPLEGLRVGGSGLTWRPDEWQGADGSVRREWVAAVRLSQQLPFLDWYVEQGWKEGWDYDPFNDRRDPGNAFYANVNLYGGPFSASWEHSDYRRFAVVPNADGKTPLNRPPSLTRDFTWTLLNRAPHPMDQNDEQGHNLDLLYATPGGWSILASGVRLEKQDGEQVYEMAYGTVRKDRVGDFRLQGGFAYQDKEGLRQTLVAEVGWLITDTRSLTLQAEHQHVRLGGGDGFDFGAYDEDWFKLEYETAPRWAFAAVIELNNKYEEQMAEDEKSGPFPAGIISYTIARGGNLNFWFGKRQAGYLCSGGVCKFEPAFEGVEFYGVFRY